MLALPLWAQSFEVWSAKAARAQKKGDKPAAIQYWSNALFKWKPADGKKARAKALASRASLQDDPALALKDLSEAVKTDPKDAKLAHRRGKLLLERGDAQAALADFYAATKLDLEFGQAYFDRARAYEALGDSSFALEDYRAACQLGVKAACGKKKKPTPAAKKAAPPEPRVQASEDEPEAAPEPEPQVDYSNEPLPEEEPSLGTEIERGTTGAPKECVASIQKCAEADGGTYEACVPKGRKCPEMCVYKFRKALNSQSEAQAFREIFESGRSCD